MNIPHSLGETSVLAVIEHSGGRKDCSYLKSWQKVASKSAEQKHGQIMADLGMCWESFQTSWNDYDMLATGFQSACSIAREDFG